jgi:hypothetical protein
MRLAPVALAAALALAAAGCASNEAPAASGAAPTADSPASASAPAPDEPTAASPEAGTDEATAESPAPEAVAAAGAWIDRAGYEDDAAGYHAAGDVVLFFNAAWCPTCQQTVRNLDAQGVPPGLTVVSVDFDSSTDLRRQYGVTVQHTFVQVDESGQPLATFTGSLTGDEIAAQTA